ncbi:MAG: glycosyl transferase family 1 [Candidatus Binatia bacterium]|nr:MAG: glycosyl transferase family 1 [Candidatus Binatia bacterium]
MRIAISAILGIRGGPARYAAELIRALAALPGSHELLVVCDDASALNAAGRPVREVVEIPLRHPWEQGFWEERAGAALRAKGVDVYHGTKGTLPVAVRIPRVVTVHDLAVFHQPESFAPLQRIHQKVLVPLSVRLAHRVIADSEHARQDLLRTLRTPHEKIAVVPLAASDVFHAEADSGDDEILRVFGVDRPYVLYAGTLQPRKHVESLVEAFVSLDLAPVRLVLVGRRRPGYAPSFLQSPPPGVHYLGEVPDRALAALYRHALAFCSPSGYEGFGLSFLEALACGCPVIAPRHSSIPEVVGEAALFLPAVDREAIAAALRRVCGDAALREQLRRKGIERARLFSWRRTAEQTLAVYREVVSG